MTPARGLLYVGTGNNYSVPAGICTAPGQTGCTQPAADDYLDSILALRLSDGAVAWVDHTLDTDLWTLPQPSGPDFDFGAGPNLFTIRDPVTGRTRHWPEKRGVLGGRSRYRQGRLADRRRPGGQWRHRRHRAWHGTDGRRIYAAEGDTARIPYTPGGSGPYAGQVVSGGSWAALDPATGKILWQTPDPHGDFDISFVTGGSVYWGSGYCGTACLGSAPATNNNKVYAFSLGR